jgi:hypothetical protein
VIGVMDIHFERGPGPDRSRPTLTRTLFRDGQRRRLTRPESRPMPHDMYPALNILYDVVACCNAQDIAGQGCHCCATTCEPAGG